MQTVERGKLTRSLLLKIPLLWIFHYFILPVYASYICHYLWSKKVRGNIFKNIMPFFLSLLYGFFMHHIHGIFRVFVIEHCPTLVTLWHSFLKTASSCDFDKTMIVMLQNVNLSLQISHTDEYILAYHCFHIFRTELQQNITIYCVLNREGLCCISSFVIQAKH